MAIVVKEGTVISAHGNVTIGENAKLAVNSKIGKNVNNKSSGSSSGSSSSKEYFTDSSGNKLSSYETAAIKATGGGMTTSSGGTDYATVSVEKPIKQSSAPLQETQFVSSSELRRRQDLSNLSNGSSGKNTSFERSGPMLTSSSTGQAIYAPTGQATRAVAHYKERSDYARKDKLIYKNDQGKRVVNFSKINDNPIRNIFVGAKEVYTTGYVSPGSNAINTEAKTFGGALGVGLASNPFASNLGARAATQTIKVAGAPVRYVGNAVVSGAPKGFKGITAVLYTAESSYLGGKLGYEITKSTSSKESKAFINTGESKAAYEIANANALQDKSKVSQYLISNIPGGKKITGYDQAAFDSSVKDYATQKGYNPNLFAQSVKDYGKARNVGTTTAILTGNTASEAVGGALFSGSAAFTTGQTIPVKGAFAKLFVQGAKVTGVAGIGEGGGIALGMEASTGKGLKDFNYEFVAQSAALGGVTAAAGGGLIYATSVLKPKISKGLLGVAYATEPAEYFGDVAGGGTGAGIIKTPGAITFTNSKTNTNALASTQSPTSSLTTSSDVRVLTSGVFTSNTVNTRANTNPFTNVNIRSNIFNPTNTNTNTNNFVYNPSNTPSNTNTNTNVNTPTPTNTFVNVFTTTSKAPLGFGNFGSSNKGVKMGNPDFFKQSRSYNPSLTASVLGLKGEKPGLYGLKSGLGLRRL